MFRMQWFHDNYISMKKSIVLKLFFPCRIWISFWNMLSTGEELYTYTGHCKRCRMKALETIDKVVRTTISILLTIRTGVLSKWPNCYKSYNFNRRSFVVVENLVMYDYNHIVILNDTIFINTPRRRFYPLINLIAAVADLLLLTVSGYLPSNSIQSKFTFTVSSVE